MNKNGTGKSEEKTTSASVWRKSRDEGFYIVLPSGNGVILRPVALDQLIKDGEIPDFLTPVAARSLWTETESTEIMTNDDLSVKYITLIDRIVPLAMKKPAVVPVPRDGEEEIALEDIEFMDKVAIFNLAIQPSSVLKTFREQQAERLANLSSGKDD